MHKIVFHHLKGSRAGHVEVFPLSTLSALSIGRDVGCALRFDPAADLVVSRNHAMIEWTQENPPLFRLVDLLSSNGTFLNGRRIAANALLRHGDKIRLGKDGPEFQVNFESYIETQPGLGQNKGSIRRTEQIPLVTTTSALPKKFNQ